MNIEIQKKSIVVVLSRILIVFVSMFVVTLSVQAKGTGTGVDPIFDMMGVAKPTQWHTWSEREKFTYLQERGAYPLSGRKYQGSFDVTRYFAHLGIAEPATWRTMTTSERQDFIASLHSQTVSHTALKDAPIGKVEKNAVEEHPTESVAEGAVVGEREQVGEADSPAVQKVRAEQKSPIDTLWVRIFFIVVGGGVGLYALRQIKAKNI